MKSLIIAFVVLLVLMASVPAFGFDEWTQEQKSLQLSLTILAVADYQTTIYGLENLPLKESEPEIYGHPTRQMVLDYGLKLYLGHLLVSYILPSKIRNYWLIGANIFQVKCVGNNISLGAKIVF